MGLKKLAIVSTHPIQYNSPWFKLLNEKAICELKVFYTWEQANKGSKYDPGFKRDISWDIPLLDGYDFVFVRNISTDPGSHHFKVIINPTLIDDIKLWGADFILVFGWCFNSHLKCLRHFHGRIPVLFRGDSTLLDEERGVKRVIRRFFLKWVYGNVDYALYVGENNKKYFITHGLKEKQLVFAPHAIDIDRFRDPDNSFERNAKEWRDKLKIRRDDMVLLFAGKLERKKNPLVLWEIAKKFDTDRLKFLIVGNGELELTLKEMTKADKRFHFIEFQNQQMMPVVYRMCNIFILPSVGPGETWGLAVNEAMACERAVLVSDKCGCFSDLVINGKTGYTFSADNKEELFNTMQNILNSTSILEMGLNARKRVETFSFGEITRAVSIVLSYKE